MSAMSVTCYDRAAFVSSMDLNADGKVDDAEQKVGKLLFYQIAGEGDAVAGQSRTTFTAENYRNFASDKNHLLAAAKIPTKFGLSTQKASDMVAHAALFELRALKASDPDHKLSARAQTLDALFQVVGHQTPKADPSQLASDQSSLASHLWATIPALYLSDLKTSLPRLKEHVPRYKDDAKARGVLDSALCSAAQDVILGLSQNHTARTVTIQVLTETHDIDPKDAARGEKAALDWIKAEDDLETLNPGDQPSTSSLPSLRRNRREIEAYRDAFSKL